MIAIASATILELTRRRFVIAAFVATLGIAALTGWGFSSLHNLHADAGKPIGPLQVKAIASILVILIAYMFSFVLAFAATLISSPALASEVESGVALPVLARPISRTAVVAGKALGLTIVLIVYAAFCGSIEFAIVDAATGYIPPHPVAATAALSALAIVMMALTLAIGSRLQMIAASIVAIVAFGVAWMAGIVASVGLAYHNEVLERVGTISQLLLPTDALWRIAVYQLEPAIYVNQMQARGGWAGPFFVVTPPPPSVEIWTVIWIVAVIAIAARSFSARDV